MFRVGHPQSATMLGMKRPIFVRPLSDAEREALEEGLRSSATPSSSAVARSCSKAQGATTPTASPALWGATPRRRAPPIKRFNKGGLQEALRKHSSRPKKIRAAFDEGGAERLREMLHRSPREFGKPTSLWTLALAAEASFEEGA